MTSQELRELSKTVAGIMEPEPPMIPLHAIRKQGDENYNYAERTSAGGWWVAQTGTDAGKSSDFCKWEPVDATEPARAMEVLKMCNRKGRIVMESGRNGSTVIWEHRLENNSYVTEAKTIELAICLFAKKLYTK